MWGSTLRQPTFSPEETEHAAPNGWESRKVRTENSGRPPAWGRPPGGLHLGPRAPSPAPPTGPAAPAHSSPLGSPNRSREASHFRRLRDVFPHTIENRKERVAGRKRSAEAGSEAQRHRRAAGAWGKRRLGGVGAVEAAALGFSGWEPGANTTTLPSKTKKLRLQGQILCPVYSFLSA